MLTSVIITNINIRPKAAILRFMAGSLVSLHEHITPRHKRMLKSARGRPLDHLDVERMGISWEIKRVTETGDGSRCVRESRFSTRGGWACII